MSDFYVQRTEEDSLAHYGVLGMKWGVRRYQNEDGTLTAEGKERYREDKRQYKEDQKKAESVSREATIYGHAAQVGQKRADRAWKKLDRAIEKGRSEKRIEKLQEKADLADEVAKSLWDDYDAKVKEGEDHIAQLIERYGEENVKGFNYRNNKAGAGTDRDKLVNESTVTTGQLAVSAALTTASVMGSIFGNLPFFVITTPKSARQMGAERANARYFDVRKEHRKEQREGNG